jgi:hypothetical protein
MRVTNLPGLVVATILFLCVAGGASAQGRAYAIGSPSYTDIWVDPVAGNDANTGTTRSVAVRTVDRAWRMIPVNSPSTPFTTSGYRIRLVAGTYPEANLPNYWDDRYGTATAPIVIEAADGPRTAILQGDINMAQVAYVYLLNLDIVPQPAGDAFHCESCDHILIRNGRLIGGTWSRTVPAASLAHETVKVNQSTHVYIEDSEIRGAEDNALDFVGVQYGHVVRSRIGNAQDWCGYAKGGSAYLVIEGNTFSDCGTGGFTVGQGTGFQFMTSPWTHYEGYGISVINNLVRQVDGAGLGVNGGYNVLFAWNTLIETGRRSHVVEVVFGSRSCDGVDGPDRVRCSEYLAAGGWGTTRVDDGSNYVRIPNKHVYVLNNLIYNPSGAQSEYQHFAIPSAFSGVEQAGSNVPSPARADDDLRIQGNVIWNGSSSHALGVGSDTGCLPSNTTCNPTQLVADNTINTVRPVFVNESAADYRVAAGGLPAPVAVPAFVWTDRPTSPLAPVGNARDAITVDFNGAVREASNHAGAFVPVRPAITVSPAVLRFHVTKNGAGAAALTAKTSAQSVSVSFVSGAPTWTLTADQPWIDLSSSATTRTGAASVTVDVSNVGNVIGSATTLTATLTIATSTGSHTPQTVTVLLTVDQTNGSGTTRAFGQMDTPAQDATGVQGAIGVTGWALDDVGVTGVKIYRNCLAFENQASCQTVLGHLVVFVGDAAFLAGARPDVEAAFATYPQAYRAGWGYLMLTSMLPHVPGNLGYGGQGALTLYAIATDAEGRQTLLGRSFDPASPSFSTPTRITMDNATIAKPFGAIDTPAQGATVSGALNNFGWTLTPDSNTIGGEGADILIPINGSTVTVFIDGLPTALVTYNQCRGSVGNPVAAGVYCNDDVSNIFGHATPQAALTLRTANVTRYRNLDAGRSAIGSFTINTATLSNGLHTIAWSVTDSAGRTEGIGSRFFNVLNSGADAPLVPFGRRVFRPGMSAGPEGPASEDKALRSAPAQDRGLASSLDAFPPGDDGVWYRTGFDLMTPWIDLPIVRTPGAGDAGRREVTIPEGGRVELWLGAPVDAGYLVTPTGALRDLPPGASLKGPQFAWVPPVGYVGDYVLAFVRGNERVEVVVRIR